MDQVNIAINLYSALICLILLFSMWLNGSTKEKSDRFFMGMCLFNIGMILGDIPAWAFEGHAQVWYPAALKIGSAVFWSSSAPLLLMLTGYILEYLPIWRNPRRILWRVACTLAAVYLLCSILSYWNGMFFTIGDGNTYQRGDWYWLSQLISFFFFGLDTTLILICWKEIRKRDALIISSYVLLAAVALLIQIFNYGIALINTGTAISILIIYINIQSQRELRMEQQKKELTEAQIGIMLSQIQPHFLYNTLTTIRQLCELNPRDAKDAISDFSRFLRANMDSLTNKAPIPFEQELTHVRHYLNLEQRRFGQRLHVVYEITARDFFIPPLTLQPIAENAVRHGILRRENGGTVTIRSEETELSYVVVVLDDGVGFSHIPAETDQGHIGIANVRKRLLTLCGGTLEFFSAPEKGSTVVMTIPKGGKDHEISDCR
ncbi:transcriptional regulator [Aminipila butyrica]|uniref:Transcriptional regulator n=1 Tax=Aminipila butyrica TaxID=433296 RepID=A0A858BV43_9FIRM|nr:histidine kinase [Aminipila butyrica]QIB69059.1 transcriptional regulator [Aminipila butyrica]